jgi:hypothetical protein
MGVKEKGMRFVYPMSFNLRDDFFEEVVLLEMREKGLDRT